MQATGRRWFMRFIRPSHKSHAFMRFLKPSMFVCTLARVSECETLTHRLPGMCGCMSYVVCICLCFSRALPILISMAMCIYALCICVWYVIWCVCTYGAVVCKCCRTLPPNGENGRFVYSGYVVVCVCVWYIISSM